VGPDDLLLQVLLSPHDEALRSVYVDSLLERGDPRGEHAVLLRQGRLEEAAALERVNTERWLTPSLARFVVPGAARFRDGLLEACALQPVSGLEANELAADPFWSAVRELRSPPRAVIAQATSLERLTGVDDVTLGEMVGWQTPLPSLRHLGLRVAAANIARDHLLSLHTPELESLLVIVSTAGENARHRFPTEAEAQCCEECARPREPVDSQAFHPSVWDTLSVLRLCHLELHIGYVHLGRFIAALEQTRFDLRTLRVRGAEENLVVPKWCLRLERTSPGRYRRLVVETEPDGPDEAIDVHEVLVTLPASVELEPARFNRPRWRKR
jgi:hypothetical protein